MVIYLLTEHHLEFLSLKLAAQGRLSLHLSKCHIVGNHMPRLIMLCITHVYLIFEYILLYVMTFFIPTR